jgi:hypothetical protein
VRCAHGPLGITSATDTMLFDIQSSMNAWQAELPETLHFETGSRNQGAGLLHMMFNCVNVSGLAVPPLIVSLLSLVPLPRHPTAS